MAGHVTGTHGRIYGDRCRCEALVIHTSVKSAPDRPKKTSRSVWRRIGRRLRKTLKLCGPTYNEQQAVRCPASFGSFTYRLCLSGGHHKPPLGCIVYAGRLLQQTRAGTESKRNLRGILDSGGGLLRNAGHIGRCGCNKAAVQ